MSEVKNLPRVFQLVRGRAGTGGQAVELQSSLQLPSTALTPRSGEALQKGEGRGLRVPLLHPLLNPTLALKVDAGKGRRLSEPGEL